MALCLGPGQDFERVRIGGAVCTTFSKTMTMTMTWDLCELSRRFGNTSTWQHWQCDTHTHAHTFAGIKVHVSTHLGQQILRYPGYLSSIPKLYIVSTIFAQFYSIFMAHKFCIHISALPFKIFKFDILTGHGRVSLWVLWSLLPAQLCNVRSPSEGGSMKRCMPYDFRAGQRKTCENCTISNRIFS